MTAPVRVAVSVRPHRSREDAAPAMPLEGPLVDRYGRVHDDLRISVTDRCNLRCVYCMPEEGLSFLRMDQLLTFDEITRVARVARSLGVTALRITGGEPLVRKGLPALIARLAALGFEDLAVTTNGTELAGMAGKLASAGLRRVNVSCDSLRPERFAAIRRRGVLSEVLRAMDAAEAAGLTPLKVNVVLLRGHNDDEILDFASFARATGRIVRFIEFMPLDAQGDWDRARLVPGREVFDRISARWPLEPLARRHGRTRRAVPLHRRGRRDRTHLERHGALLWHVQPPPAHRGRRCAELPLHQRRRDRAGHPAQRRHRCRALPPAAGSRLGQTSRTWDQRAGVPQPVAIDVDDRRVAMARLRLFGPAREAAGTSGALVPGDNVAAVVAGARARFGEQFSTVLDRSRLWVNGEEADPDTPVDDDDEVAVIPPVSGGCA